MHVAFEGIFKDYFIIGLRSMDRRVQKLFHFFLTILVLVVIDCNAVLVYFDDILDGDAIELGVEGVS